MARISLNRTLEKLVRRCIKVSCFFLPIIYPLFRCLVNSYLTIGEGAKEGLSSLDLDGLLNSNKIEELLFVHE